MSPEVTRAERTSTLDAEIEYYVARGWRLRSRTSSEALLVKGQPVSHWVHLFFTIVTVGLWLLVWVPLAIFGGEKQKRIVVDAQGFLTSH